ncbi:AMP-binding protein [Mumia sp. DW29H23]|uniref:AMP-binding protein n=1 Tax=Mumia sp. DW29H23 TaxID=3421241 RepID=UPI003D68D419
MTEPTWFTRPSDGAPGTLNAVYDLLDRPVVLGRADATAVSGSDGALSYAVLLEQVAAFGGLLRALGVRPGDAVAVTAPVSTETVVALLATARIGATPWVGGDPAGLVSTSDPALVVADGVQMESVAAAVDALDPQRPRAIVVVRPGEWTLLETRDVAWAPALKAGGTDPAAVQPVVAGTPFVVAPAGATYASHDHDGVAGTPPAGALDGAEGAAWTGELVRDLVASLGAGGVALDG